MFTKTLILGTIALALTACNVAAAPEPVIETTAAESGLVTATMTPMPAVPGIADPSEATPTLYEAIQGFIKESDVNSPTETVYTAPDAMLDRMKRQYLQEELLAEATPLAGLSKVLAYTSDYVKRYVPVYLATACIQRQDPSVQGFREYVINHRGSAPDGLAKEAINQIRALAGESRPCFQPYMAPVSMLDAGPAIDLYTVYAERQVSPPFRDGIPSRSLVKITG